MKRGDIVHGIVPKFSPGKHYFIVVSTLTDRFKLLPITSKEKKWDLCFQGECVEYSKYELEQEDVTLKLNPSYLFLGIFKIEKDCCTNTRFKATQRLLNKLKILNIKYTE